MVAITVEYWYIFFKTNLSREGYEYILGIGIGIGFGIGARGRGCPPI